MQSYLGITCCLAIKFFFVFCTFQAPNTAKIISTFSCWTSIILLASLLLINMFLTESWKPIRHNCTHGILLLVELFCSVSVKCWNQCWSFFQTNVIRTELITKVRHTPVGHLEHLFPIRVKLYQKICLLNWNWSCLMNFYSHRNNFLKIKNLCW